MSYEDEYQKGMTIFDDEGWLSQTWEDYNWFSEIIDILSNQNALKTQNGQIY